MNELGINAKELRDALSLAYMVLTDDRNLNRYSMSGIRNMNTMELFEYSDMLRVLRNMHDVIAKLLNDAKQKHERRSHLRYAFDYPDGLQVRGYTLYDDKGCWLGDVTLDYRAASHCLRLFLISDYGNYAYRWDGAGDKGYAAFILGASNDYLTDKLATGHGEDRVLLISETGDAIWKIFSRDMAGEDADWMGEAREALMRCATEEAYFAWSDTYGMEYISEHFVYGWGGYLPGLCRRLLPELKRVLREEREKGGEPNGQRKAHDGA